MSISSRRRSLPIAGWQGQSLFDVCFREKAPAAYMTNKGRDPAKSAAGPKGSSRGQGAALTVFLIRIGRGCRFSRRRPPDEERRVRRERFAARAAPDAPGQW